MDEEEKEANETKMDENQNEKKGIEEKDKKKEDIVHEEEKKPEKEYFLYFIETHPEDISLNINLVDNKHAKELKKIKEDFIKVLEETKNYTINRLRITSSRGLGSLEIKFKLSAYLKKKKKKKWKKKKFFFPFFKFFFKFFIKKIFYFFWV